MKKSTKIALSCILGVAVLGGVTTAICINSNSSLSGTIYEGKGTYDWVKYDVHIDLHEGRKGTSNGEKDETKYYTNCRSYSSNDCIYNLYYRYYGEYITTSSEPQDILSVVITYNQIFYISDDLDTFFVLSNGLETYTTDIETSHLFEGEEEIEFTGELAKKLYEGNYFIREIWVRTVD